MSRIRRTDVRDPENFSVTAEGLSGAERLRRAKTPANQRGRRAFYVQRFWEATAASVYQLTTLRPLRSLRLKIFLRRQRTAAIRAYRSFSAGRWIRRRQGAKPHGRMDEVMSPKKPVSKIPTSNQEPTLSVAAFPDASAHLVTYSSVPASRPDGGRVAGWQREVGLSRA